MATGMVTGMVMVRAVGIPSGRYFLPCLSLSSLSLSRALSLSVMGELGSRRTSVDIGTPMSVGGELGSQDQR